MKHKLNAKRIVLLLAVVAVVAVAALWPKKDRMAVAPAGEQVYSIRSIVVERTAMQEYLTMNGNVEAENTISVYPDIGGKITRVHVTLGSNVRKGQLIAEVDPSVPGSVYAASPVYAPISGTITSLPLTTGTSVNTSTAIAQLGDITQLQVRAQVPERDVAVLKNGLTGEISLEAYPGEVFTAKVFRVSPVVDEVSRSKEIYYVFDGDDSRINAGMYAKIKLNTVLHEDVISLPTDCIVTKNGEQGVYVVADDMTVSFRLIEQGVIVDSMVQVLSGLSDGERVVINGMQSLTDGAKVKEVGGN